MDRSGNLELQKEQLILNSAHKTVNKIVKLLRTQLAYFGGSPMVKNSFLKTV